MKKSKRKLWFSILKEYLSLYQTVASNLNSKSKEKDHAQEVITKIKAKKNDFNLSGLQTAVNKPVCDYLEQVLKTEKSCDQAAILSLLAQITEDLVWEYGYDDLPEELKAKYAYAEILGPQGPILGDDLILGLVLLGPNCIYPEHSHQDIAESYLVLNASVTINSEQSCTSGDFIYNEPGEKHELATASEPCLLAYAWSAKAKILKSNQLEFD